VTLRVARGGDPHGESPFGKAARVAVLKCLVMLARRDAQIRPNDVRLQEDLKEMEEELLTWTRDLSDQD